MAINNTDVVILGGGPAGAAAAITLLQSGLSVIVIEKSDYTGPRIGETLSPGTQGLLRHLGVWEPFVADGHEPSYGTAATWGSNLLQVRDFIYSPFGTGWHLDRQRFDAMFAKAVMRAGGVVRIGAQMLQCTRTPKGLWRLATRESEILARFVIDTTGKSSRFARSMGIRPRITDRLVGVAGILRFHEHVPQNTMTLVESVENGWWYSARLPDGSMIVTLMSDADIVRTMQYALPGPWQTALNQTIHTFDRTHGGERTGPLRIYLAHSAFVEDPVGDGWIAAGDAAACYDPLSSSGIPKALHSGILAAQAVSAFLQRGADAGFAEYRALQAEGFRMYHAVKLRYYAIERRWPAFLFWQRRR